MYNEHFGMITNPFENTPDPDFFFMGGDYRETLALMKHAVVTRKGMICIAGPIGCGKTTLAAALVQNLPETALIINPSTPKGASGDLTAYVAEKLSIGIDAESQLSVQDMIRRALIKMNEQNTLCVLILDEAQFLDETLFEEILFLANLETDKCKLIQIILLGQMELIEKLNDPKRQQIAQRIIKSKILTPMNAMESEQYIRHRLTISQCPGEIFPSQVMEFIVRKAGGIPRNINKLCDTSLLYAFLAQRDSVTGNDVEKAIQDTGLSLYGRNMLQMPLRQFPDKPQTEKKDQPADTKSKSKLTAGYRWPAMTPRNIIIFLFLTAIIFSFVLNQPVEKNDHPLPETISSSAPKNHVVQKAAEPDPVVVVPEIVNEVAEPKEEIEVVPAEKKEVLEIQKTEPAVTMPEKETTNHPYTILLASYRNQADVDRALPYYSEMKLSPYWTRVDLGENGVWYRVFTGHYSEYKDAAKERERLNLEGSVVKKVAYTVLIGTYPTKNEADTDIYSLKNNGFPSFLLPTDNGSFALYSGAFYTKDGAATHCADLSTYGYTCMVAEQ